MNPVARVRDLLRLASGEGDEARTAAHLAAKLIAEHGLVVVEPTQVKEEPKPAPRRPYTPKSKFEAQIAAMLAAAAREAQKAKEK